LFSIWTISSTTITPAAHQLHFVDLPSIGRLTLPHFFAGNICVQHQWNVEKRCVRTLALQLVKPFVLLGCYPGRLGLSVNTMMRNDQGLPIFLFRFVRSDPLKRPISVAPKLMIHPAMRAGLPHIKTILSSACSLVGVHYHV